MSEGYEDETISCDNCRKKLNKLPIFTLRTMTQNGIKVKYNMFDFCSKECMFEYLKEDSADE